jgi:uncharacterized RDD family membrane protein YckC
MTQAPLVSEFYERKRRLAYLFAGLSVALLLADLYIGFSLEGYSHPRVAAAPDGVVMLHRVTGEEQPGSRLGVLDPSLSLRHEPWSLEDEATAILPEGGELTVFFGNRYSVLRDGRTMRSADLGQPWSVKSSVLDPSREVAWIFGWAEGKLLARKRVAGSWSEEITLAAATEVDRISSSMDGETGPVIAWRERGSPKVATAIFDGRIFVPGVEFRIGDIEHWDIVSHEGRLLCATYHREDRTFEWVTLRLECCPDCGKPPPPEKVAFADPLLLLGRRVTGLALVRSDKRLVFLFTRWTTAQAASLPLATLLPEPGEAILQPIGAKPLWQHVAVAFVPILTLFFSFSMVFLGLCLLRERVRAARLEVTVGPLPAEPLQRAMAWMLDQIAVAPFFLTALELLDLSPETSVVSDPKLPGMAGLGLAFAFVYPFAMEWGLGWTIGKKILGIRVTELDGSRLSLRGALVRNLLRLVEANLLFLLVGGTVMMLTRRRQRLGDLLGKTLVIQEPRRSGY